MRTRAIKRRFISALSAAAVIGAVVFIVAAGASAAEEKAATGTETAALDKSTVAQVGTGGEVKESGVKQKRYYPEGTPTRAIQELDDMLDDFKVAEKGKNLSAADQAHNTQLKQKIIHGTFDIQELSRQSLGGHWNQISEGERSRFVGLLTDLLEQIHQKPHLTAAEVEEAISGAIQYHYGITQSDFYTVLFGISRSLGLTTHAVWCRALGRPIERPKSLTTRILEQMISE